MAEHLQTTAEPVAIAVADMTPQEAQAELSKREAAKLTRRAALAKIGLRAGLGVLAALSVDDLARMVARRIEQQAEQNAVVDKVARELRGAGIAFADTGGGPAPTPNPTPTPLCQYIDDTGAPYTAPCQKCNCKDDTGATYQINCGEPPPGCTVAKAKDPPPCPTPCNLCSVTYANACGEAGSGKYIQYGYSNALLCCQSMCESCCAPSDENATPCGDKNQKDTAVYLCQQGCANHYGAIG